MPECDFNKVVRMLLPLLPHLSQIVKGTNRLFESILYFRVFTFYIFIKLNPKDFFLFPFFQNLFIKEIFRFGLLKIFQYYFIILFKFVRRK